MNRALRGKTKMSPNSDTWTTRPPANAVSAPQTDGTTADISMGESPFDAPVGAPKMATPTDGFIEHYEIIRQLGEGGMGAVYLARDTKLGRLVALKILLGSAKAESKLLAEAQVTARAQHPNIVVIHDVGTFADCPYMVLEYLEGKTLRQVLSTNRQQGKSALPMSLALNIVSAILKALSAAHERGIVHRDLKPENVMLVDSGPIKVLDFGIALHEQVAKNSARAGTRSYMAPEQWLGHQANERTDLWAIGLILYELLTGRHPLAHLSSERFEFVTDLDTPMPSLLEARPDLPGIAEIVERCLRKNPNERFASALEVLSALAPWVDDEVLPLGEADVSPFAGLHAFQRTDAKRFFGRERDVATVMGMVHRQTLVTIAGPSGAGKSSFVRAGLVPALKRSGDVWDTLVFRPGSAPLTALREALATIGLDGVDVENRAQPGLAGTRLRAFCRDRGSDHRLLVFVDQFEELQTLVPDAAERNAFIECLLGIADDESSALRVVLAIRSDFLDRNAEHRQFMKRLGHGLYFLPPMSTDGLRDALVCPVEAAGYHFESEQIIADFLRELEQTRQPLPILQFAAAQLWEFRDRDRMLLTQQGYERIGGVAGALSSHADAVVGALSAVDQRLCRDIFLRLVTPERTRAIVSLDELAPLGTDPAALDAVIQRLAAARLLLVDTGGNTNRVKVELVHESLIDRWYTLARWIEESAGGGIFLARLRAAAAQWKSAGEPIGLLWRDREADEASAFYNRMQEYQRGQLNALEERYLRAVITFADRLRSRKRRQIAGAFAMVCLVAGVVSVLALRASAQAKRADEEAAHVRKQNKTLAFQALVGRNVARVLAARKHEDDPTLVVALLREVENASIPKDWSELVSAAFSNGIATARRIIDDDSPVYGISISPDGGRIAVAMNDGTVRLLDAKSLVEQAVLRGHTLHVWSVDWSADGKRIISASGDNTSRISFVDGMTEPIVLRGHDGPLNMAKFSPDGLRAVTASDDGTARLWRADDGRELAILRHDAEVVSVDFSADGARLVTASVDGTARIWNADGQGKPLLLRGHTDMVRAAEFSPDGTRVATVSKDRTVRIWDARSGDELVVLQGHQDKIMGVAWSHDGKRVASACKDKTIRIWDADGHGEPIIFRGHTNWVYAVQWTPDDRHVASVSLDRTIRLWDVAGYLGPVVLRGHEDIVNSAVLSPDGKRVLTAASDKTARVWNTDGTGQTKVFRGHTDLVVWATWSPDATRFVTISFDGTGRIWTVDDSKPPVVLRGSGGIPRYVSWSRRGEPIAIVSIDGTIQFWSPDGDDLGMVKRFSIDSRNNVSVEFDPSGNRMFAHDDEHDMLHLVPAEDPTKLTVLGRYEDDTVAIAHWSPDGKHVLTISKNRRNVVVWNVDEHEAAWKIPEAKPVSHVAWSPDGQRIATAFFDDTIRIWQLNTKTKVVEIKTPRTRLGVIAWSPDGTRIIVVAEGNVALVRHADGSGEPFVLGGAKAYMSSIQWSSDGQHIATRSEEKIVRIWPGIQPFSGPEDNRLWAATSFCIPPTARVELLNTTEVEAVADYERCLEKVALAHSALALP